MKIIKVGKVEEVIPALVLSCLEPKTDNKESLAQLNHDASEFCAYIKNSLQIEWELVNEISNCQVTPTVNPSILIPPQTTLVIAKHYAKQIQSGIIVDAYQIFLWIRDKGIGISNVFQTELHHPIGSKDHILDLEFRADIRSLTADFIIMDVHVSNYVQPWLTSHEFLFNW